MDFRFLYDFCSFCIPLLLYDHYHTAKDGKAKTLK